VAPRFRFSQTVGYSPLYLVLLLTTHYSLLPFGIAKELPCIATSRLGVLNVNRIEKRQAPCIRQRDRKRPVCPRFPNEIRKRETHPRKTNPQGWATTLVCPTRLASVRFHLSGDGVYQDRSLEILAKVPSNFVMEIVNGSAYDFARSFKMLSAICSPNKMDQKDELRK